MRRVVLTVFLLGALGLAGCAPTNPAPAPSGTGTGTGTGSPIATAGGAGLVVPVSITRAGGIAGVRQTLTVSADGSWTFTDAKSNKTSQGQLTGAQLTALVTLLTNPDLIRQLSNHGTPSGVCNDGFDYTIQFGAADTFSFTDCGTLEPAVKAVIQALTDDTAF